MSWRVAAVYALVGWGAFAFGAVYPWAYMPLFAVCAIAGAVALAQPGGAKLETTLLAAAAALLAAIALQLVPLPQGAIQAISPETDVFLRRHVFGYDGGAKTHPLSIAPWATALGLGAAAALSLLLLGLARTLRRDDTIWIIRGLCAMGVVLALVGIVQRSLWGAWDGLIYGFWQPQGTGMSFGPFVNRNHFAGWMLMAMPLAMGYFCGRIAQGTRSGPPGWAGRVRWLSSPDANETLLVGFAVLVMAVATVFTTSRSGVLCLIAAVTLAGLFVALRQATRTRRAVGVAFLALVLVMAVGVTGTERLMTRFAEDEASNIGNRPGIWRDTWRVARAFPLTGTGLNTFGTAMLEYQTVDTDKVHYREAHSDYLQLVAEGGLLVSVPAAALILVYAGLVRRRFRALSPDGLDYWIRVGAVTGLAALALQEVAEFSLQMPGNAVLFVVLLAVALRPVSARRPAAQPPPTAPA